MTLRDSLLVIAHRERFPDLAAALALIGVALDRDLVPATLSGTPTPEAVTLFADDVESGPQAAGADGWSADDIRLVEKPVSPTRSESEADAEAAIPPEDGSAHTSPPLKPTAPPAGRPREKPPSVIAAVIDADFQSANHARVGAASLSYVSVPKSWSPGPAGRPTVSTAFNMRTLSSTLHSMVRVVKDGAEPDVDAVVARIASGEPLTRVPMTRRRGPPGRICVLCDLNLRSGPYRDDVRHLIRVARRLFGDGTLEFLTFKGTPARGCGTGPVWTWGSYEEQPPFDVTMIIGSGTANRHGDPRELHSFAMQLIAADRQVCVILIGAEPGEPTSRPYPQLLVQD
jgi:hypothetical protein